ncbi:MAG: hypothetical protein GY869_07100, partial [Planctomycetes bacterium]|nr:hypothetical protein [Planctomycetota bacterium]
HPYNPQEDISGAVNIFSFTLVSFDREKYLSVLHGDELMIKVATATFDYLAAFKNFENAYISTFGPGAWNNFSPDPSTIDIDTLKRNLAIMEIQQINDRAICIMPGSDQPPVHTIRIDGLWYINLDLMIPYNPTQAKQFVKHQNEIILLLQSMQPLIGNPDYPIEKFNAEYEKRLNDLIKSP